MTLATPAHCYIQSPASVGQTAVLKLRQDGSPEVVDE